MGRVNQKGKSDQNKLRIFESEKQKLMQLPLSYEEYEMRIKELARELQI